MTLKHAIMSASLIFSYSLQQRSCDHWSPIFCWCQTKTNTPNLKFGSHFLYFFQQFLKEGLSRIDESWAAARFDSLPHVVHILTSKDREGEVQFLKEQSDLVEDVVDEVVHVYHHGFNKAIQNYSQVGHLLSFQWVILCLLV